MHTYRKATAADISRIWEIMLQAKAQMYREGKHQWTEDYPSPEIISNDIETGVGYVLCNQNSIIAYGAVVYTGEPAYLNLQGKWLSEQQYVVVHRLAVADEAKRQGVAIEFMQKVEQTSQQNGIHSFKVDTNYDNFYMLKILDRLGFTYCGEIEYKQGKRMAYEKLI